MFRKSRAIRVTKMNTEFPADIVPALFRWMQSQNIDQSAALLAMAALIGQIIRDLNDKDGEIVCLGQAIDTMMHAYHFGALEKQG